VTPGADEVCFQCWDAKIRTSPKRKIHFKAAVVDTVSPESTIDDLPRFRAAKRVERNKRRAISRDFEYTFHTTSNFSSHLASNDNKTQYDDFEDEVYNGFIDDDGEVDSTTSIYEESVIFDEENAVILLSTAFRTVPHRIHDVNININFNSYHDLHHTIVDFSNDDDDDDDGHGHDHDAFDDKAKKRGAYYCGKCGKLKKGHVCTIASPKYESECTIATPLSVLPLSVLHSTLTTLHHAQHSPTPTPTSIHLQPTFQPQAVDVSISAMVAQPVVS